MQTTLTNTIICGDCKSRIPKHITAGTVDLIYLDPPFFSDKKYDVVWGDDFERRSFEDGEWYKKECVGCGNEIPRGDQFCRTCGGSVSDAKPVRKNDIRYYADWLKERLDMCYTALKPTGSIYVHLDWHAVHYVKVAMDDIFGMENFRNDIIWCYAGGGIPKKDFPRKHDTILRYAKNVTEYKKNGVFNTEYREYGEWTKDHEPRNSLLSGGKKLDTKKGTPINDWWSDLKSLTSYKKEWIGYPTQKPEELLVRIIRVSSNKGDLILDPFCGCGTALAVAQKLGRRWIGIDISPTSCRVMVDRLNDLKDEDDKKIGIGMEYGNILDMPYTEEELRIMPHFEFQNWAVREAGFSQQIQRGADGGIDGYTTFGDPIQVKRSDKVGVGVIKEFETTIRDADKTHGVVVAFSYTRGAEDKAKNTKAKHGINIELKTVKELLQ